ncbi:MAG: diguanylate cyclase, partial [Lachnospiraceae bacterium]|nr:diguanylate cyclase [Lachnospiraceae bacterium]
QLLGHLAKDRSYSMVYRMMAEDRFEHVRNIIIMCEDKRHIICCLENFEDEIRDRLAKEQDLQSARRQARLDDLTGIRNKKAYSEMVESIDAGIRSGKVTEPFGVVMCDVNDLKLINDTRGHSYGDEVIQRTSRIICGIFKHSSVFRIGGDEFVVILSGVDYDNIEDLHKELMEESLANRLSRSGPVIASGFALFEPGKDTSYEAVYERADRKMYENKKELKTTHIVNSFANMEDIEEPIPDERRRLLDSMFGALVTVTGGGYIYINDMRYDFSRWSLSLIDDFNIDSEYMYHAEKVWNEYIHPDDFEIYREAVEAVLRGNAEVRPISYRARRPDGRYVRLTTRGFVLVDRNGDPEYFGGIIVPL